MPRRSNDEDWDELRNRIIGLGDQSSHKTYYSELKARLRELEAARRSLADSNASLQGVMDAATEVAIIVTAPDGIITLFNRGAENLLGYDAEEVVGQQTPLLFHVAEEVTHRASEVSARYGRTISGFQAVVEPAEREGAEKREWTFLRKDSRRVPTEMVVTAIRGGRGETVGYLGVAQDITQRRKAEEELRRYREQLEQLVEERTFELRVATQAAEAANRAKGTFLANMSHEIRTPMNAIMGMIHLALRTPLSPKQQEYLGKASYAAESLLGIINDILDFSKIEAGKLDLERTDFLLEEMLERVSSIVSTKAMEKGLEFLIKVNPQVPPSLSGDPLRLGQVLINLCNNAVKFTHVGEIVLEVAALSEPEGEKVPLRFSVRDTGIGMNAHQMGRLFTPFNQGDATNSRKYGGTGLGLAISRELVELMGGTIGVESVPGKGSEFHFTVTLGVGRLQPQLPAETVGSLRGLRTLVLDDSATARAVFHDLLSSLGYQVTAVSRPSEAVAELEAGGGTAHPYDLVFVDWRMPEMDGFEAAALIRGMFRSIPPVKIIMVTAYGNEAVQRQALEEGLNAYLTKPLTVSSLFDAIMSAFGREGVERVRPRPRQAAQEELLRRLMGARILLVEDNDFNQMVASELLTEGGISVTLAENGNEALELVRTNDFQAVLMDIQMPGMDGIEATRQIRAQPQYDALPIIAMTAHAMVKDRERCLSAGMNDYLSKPINPTELYEVLGRWIKQREAPAAAQTPQGGEEDALPAELPGISVQKGLQHVNNKKRFYRQMLEKFLETKRDSGLEIRREFAAGNREVAGRTAHSLKSIAGTIGADELMAAAAALEKGIDSGEDGRFEAYLAEYQKRLGEVVAGLEGFFGGGERGEPPEKRVFDREEILKLLDEVLLLLRSDVGQALTVLDRLGADLSGSGYEKDFRIVRRLTDLFELDEARATLLKLRGQIEKGGGTEA